MTKILPDTWKLQPVGEICSEIVDCINKTAPTVDGPTPYKMIRTTNVRHGRVSTEEMRYVDEKTYHQWTRRSVPKRNDIVLTREAPLGEVGLIRTDENLFLGQRTMMYRADGASTDQNFLYYALQGGIVQGQVRSWGSGATVEHLRVPDASKFQVPMPPFEEQRKIAAILTAYDDLIENNRQRIALLEKMAEEIYREWFVRLRYPEHEHTPLHKGVPEGWELKRLPDCIEVKPTERVDQHDSRPFVGMDRLSTTSAFFSVDEYRVGASGPRFRNGDTLLPRITPCLENGKRGLVMCLDEDVVACGSTEFIVLRGKSLPPEFVYCLSVSDGFRRHCENSMVGASGRQRVHEGCLNWVLIKHPPQQLAQKFSELTSPMYRQAKCLLDQNEKLEQTRDLLLNRLISGKLRVDDLDIQFPPSMQEAA